MYVGPRRCVRAPSRVPPPSSRSVYVRLFVAVAQRAQLQEDILMCARTPAPACTCAALCQVRRDALSLESAPKLRLCASITHELLDMGSHGQQRRDEPQRLRSSPATTATVLI